MHGWIHEDPLALNDPEEEWRLLSQALDTLEKVDRKRPVGNRNPSWTMSTYTMGLIKRAGLLYDSSLQAMDEPHDVLIDGQSSGLVELPVNWILDDAPFLPAYAALPSPRLIMNQPTIAALAGAAAADPTRAPLRKWPTMRASVSSWRLKASRSIPRHGSSGRSATPAITR